MKRILYTLVAGLLILGPISCKKDDPAPVTTGLPSAPEALAEHNNKSGGIYKGTFADATTSGTIKVILQGGKTEIIVVYGGVTRTLTTTDLAGWTSGQDIVDIIFTSTDWQVLFASDGAGSSFGFGLSLGGKTDFEGLIVKELSTAQVRVYEGTYAGGSEGKWNFATQGNFLAGVYTGSSTGTFDGTIAGTAITITSTGTSVTAAGTFNAEATSCSGTWTSDSSNGTWSGTRKL